MLVKLTAARESNSNNVFFRFELRSTICWWTLSLPKRSSPRSASLSTRSLPFSTGGSLAKRLVWQPGSYWRQRVNIFYRVCQGFRLVKWDDYFRVNFDHFWSGPPFLRQLGQYWKSARAYKIQITTKLSLPKSVKFTVTSYGRHL